MNIPKPCVVFVFGKALADKLSTGISNLSTQIQEYNDWVIKRGEPSLVMSNEQYEAASDKDALLTDYSKRLMRFMQHDKRIAQIEEASAKVEEDLEGFREAMGSKVASSVALVNALFTTTEQQSFKEELKFCLRNLSKRFGLETTRDYLSKETIEKIIYELVYADDVGHYHEAPYHLAKRTLTNTINEIINDLAEFGVNIDRGNLEKSIESELRKAKSELEEFVSQGIPESEYQDILDNIADLQDLQKLSERLEKCEKIIKYIKELIIVNSSEFKKIYGKSFNPESMSFDNKDDADSIQNEETETYDSEEEVRERWTIILDSLDPSGTLSHIVNEVISRIPKTEASLVEEDGKTKVEYTPYQFTDVLEFIGVPELANTDGRIPITVNPNVEARALLRLLSSSTSLADMMQRLRNEGGRYQFLINSLEKDERLKVTFFQSFNKYYQHYYFTKSDGVNLSEIHLNGTRKDIKVNRFLNALRKSNSGTSNSIFFITSNGSETQGLNMINLTGNKGLKNFFSSYVGSSTNNESMFSTFFNLSYEQQEVTIERILGYLNIPANEKTAATILSNGSSVFTFLKNVEDLINNLEGVRSTKNGMELIKSLFKAPSKGEDNSPLYRALSNILELTDSSNEYSQSYSGMISYNDGKQTAFINMSKFTDFIKRCNSSTPNEVRRLIQDDYSISSCFYDSTNKKYLVRWLEDIIGSCNQTSSRTLRKKLRISRNLGFNEVSFEEISDRGHMLSILSMYFNSLSKDNLNNNGYRKIRYIEDKNGKLASFSTIDVSDRKSRTNLYNTLKEVVKEDLVPDTYYFVEGSVNGFYIPKSGAATVETVDRFATCTIPSFITGDTLALRGITALHYTENEIAEGIYDFLRFDEKFNTMAEALNKKGLGVSENDKDVLKEMLTKKGHCFFLNPESNDHIATRDAEGNITGWTVTKGYWYNKFQELGGNSVRKEDIINEIIKPYLRNESDYFIDTQLKSLNINVEEDLKSFTGETLISYGDTLRDRLRDFWMNYKFSLMNQTAILDVSPLLLKDSVTQEKRDKGNLTNGSQLCIDAVDPKTKELVWKDSVNPRQRVLYIYDIKPQLDDRTRAFLRNIGLDEKTIEVYDEDSSLTDGQGWRSFESWRKIGLSFGKDVWTDEMENAYWEVQRLSKDIFYLENQIETLGKTPFKLTSGSLEENQERAKEKDRLQEQLSSKLQELYNISVVYQARKPINDGIENYDGMIFSFQHKYAEIPVIPALFPKDSGLRQLGRWMEENQVDMIVSSKCGKKGVFGEADLQYKVNEKGQYIDKDGNVIPGRDGYGKIVLDPTRSEQRRYKTTVKDTTTGEDKDITFRDVAVENKGENALTLKEMLDRQVLNTREGSNSKEVIKVPAYNEYGDRVFKGVIHESTLKSYLIQTNVPDKTNHETLFGTQLRKIILGGINPASQYTYKLGDREVKISGADLITLYNAAISANYMDSYSKFEYIMQDPNRLIKELSNNIVSNNRCNLTTIDQLANGVPLWTPAIQHDAITTLISLFKSRVIKQKVEGGSIVQASALGADISIRYLDEDLTWELDEEGYPIKCDAVIPFNFYYTSPTGEKIALKYEDYCNDDGTFKVDEKGNTLIENDFPGILDMVMYRIPSERDYSCVRIHIKRCCPRLGANYMQLPVIITKRMGCDFDIDKGTLYRHTYDASGHDYFTKKVWDAVFEDRKDIADALRKARAEATEAQLDEIRNSYRKEGEVPPENREDIPLNRFWNLAFAKIDKNTGHKDFDIDKNYIFKKYAESNPEFIKGNKFPSINLLNPDGSINFEAVFKAPRSVVDNLILDIILERLSDPETAKARFTPGGFDGTKLDAKYNNLIKRDTVSKVSVKEGVKILDLSNYEDSNHKDTEALEKYKDPIENRDYSDVMTAIDYNQLNQVAAKLIGIYANDSSNYFIFSKIKSMKLSDKVSPIIFGSMIGSKIADAGRNMLVRESLGKTTDQRLAELLAAAVDAVKDPVLNYLNLNEITGEAATVLIRMGYDTKDVGLLFNQPIVVETCRLMKQEGISSFKTALDIILKRHGMDSVNKLKKGNVDNKYLTREALAYNLSPHFANEDSAYYTSSQAEVAKIMLTIMKVKDEFSSIVQQTRNTSANVVKSNLGEYFSRKEKIDAYSKNEDKLIDVVINDNDDKIIIEDNSPIKTRTDRYNYFMKYSKHPFAFETVVYNLINKGFSKIVDDNTPFGQDIFTKTIEVARQWCSYGTLSSDSFNELFTDIPKVLLKHLNGDFNPNFVNPDERINPDHLTNAELYLKHIDDFINRVMEKRDEQGELTEAAFISDLLIFKDYITSSRDIIIDESDEDGTYTRKTYSQYILHPNFSLSREQVMEVYTSWAMLYDNPFDSQELRDLSVALFLHFYYSNGLQTTSEFDLKYVPANVLNAVIADYGTTNTTNSDISYADFMDGLIIENSSDTRIKSYIDAIGLSAEEIMDEVILQNLDNKQFVYHTTPSTSSKFVSTENGDSVTISGDNSYLITHYERGVKFITPYIVKDGVLYQLQGFNKDKSKVQLKSKKKQSITYERVQSTLSLDLTPFVGNRTTSDGKISTGNSYIFNEPSIKLTFGASEYYSEDNNDDNDSSEGPKDLEGYKEEGRNNEQYKDVCKNRK